MSRFAVLGSPIAHSLSPVIHQAFAKEAKLTIRFEKILTQAGTLKQTLEIFREQGGHGACVTLPLKGEAFELCDHLTEAAKTAKAVNTLYWQAGELWGDNTDGEGLLCYLQQDLNLDLQGKSVLILGAGGATRGILDPLLKAGAQDIVIVNRTLAKAQALCTCAQISAYDYATFTKTKVTPFYLVINATSCSLQDSLPPLESKWVQGAYTMDLAYKQRQETVFQQWAREQGVLLADDGLGMLVWQAALGFKRWHQFLPQVKPVIQKLRQGDF